MSDDLHFSSTVTLERCPFCDGRADFRVYPQPAVFCAAADSCLAMIGETLRIVAGRWNRRPGEERAFAQGTVEGP